MTAATVAAPTPQASTPAPASKTSVLQALEAVPGGAANTAAAAVSKLKAPMLSLLTAFAAPIARILGIAALALAVVGGAYVKGHVDEHKHMVAVQAAEIAQVKKEANDAIAAANAARDAAQKKFDTSRANPRPSSLPGRLRKPATSGFSRD